MNVLLSSAYLAPVNYFALLYQSSNVLLEKFEHYPKQTFRNRCAIYSTNGPLTLTVPVTKGNLLKIYTKDIRIDYSINWIKIHYKAVESAYSNSPFYQFYIDEIFDVIQKEYKFLFDLNFDLMDVLCNIMNIRKQISGTEEYLATVSYGVTDFRNMTSPKSRDQKQFQFEYPHYTQVFGSKFGFIENLSIIDLLFNVGPDTGDYLKQVTLKKD